MRKLCFKLENISIYCCFVDCWCKQSVQLHSLIIWKKRPSLSLSRGRIILLIRCRTWFKILIFKALELYSDFVTFTSLFEMRALHLDSCLFSVNCHAAEGIKKLNLDKIYSHFRFNLTLLILMPDNRQVSDTGFPTRPSIEY